MIVIGYSNKRPLVILRDSKNGNSRNEGVTDDESVDNTNVEERSCKTAFQNRDDVDPDDSSDILSVANDRIGVAKHDFELYHWKITTDKDNNTGISIVDPTKLKRQI